MIPTENRPNGPSRGALGVLRVDVAGPDRTTLGCSILAAMWRPHVPERLADESLARRLALAGALWALILTPPMESVWAYDPSGTDWAGMHWVPRTFGPTLESWGVLSVTSSGLDPYAVYGKGFFLVYLAMTPLALAVHRRYLASGGDGRIERWTWRALWWGLLLAALGDVASYWGVSLPGSVGMALWSNGFALETMAAALLLLPGVTGYALGLLVWPHLPRWSGLILLTWIPSSALTLLYVSAYVPNAVIAPLALLWALVGLRMPGSAAPPTASVQAERVTNPARTRLDSSGPGA